MQALDTGTDISSLTTLLGLTYGLPAVVYVVGLAWNKTVGASPKLNKFWATFCLAVPIAGLAMMANVDATPAEVAEINRLNQIQHQAEVAKVALVFQMSLRGATQSQPKGAN